jgi:dTDP-4-dehydrorhamnose reductase
VRGFHRAVFSGFTTLALGEILVKIVEQHPQLSGVWHVAAEPINKFDLLTMVRDAYGHDTKIELDKSFVCDRSLNGRRFREATGIAPPSWPEMIKGMREDATPYEEIRRTDA